MKLIELLQSPWAIVPESLREILEIYATHLKGDKIDIAGVEARLGRPLNNQPSSAYTLREGGVAVVAVEGIIAPKANLFTSVSGGTSAQLLVQQLQTAAADTRVKSVVQVIDSPGGAVLGIPEWGNAVKAVAAVKPIISVSDGNMFSAAYWGGSAANAIFLTGAMAQAGSIGVYARMGLSQPDPTAIEFVRGSSPPAGLNGLPPSPEYMARFEAQLDYMYSQFVDTVADNRGATVDQVLQHMADGRTFIGQQAVDAGLVDGIQTIDHLVEALATNPAQFASRRKAVFAVGAIAQNLAGVPGGGQPAAEPVLLAAPPVPTPEPQRTTMDRVTLAAQHPELLAALQSEFQTAGAAAERQRQADVRASALPGHEALIERMAADGTTTGAQAAAAVLAAERNLRQAQATALQNEAPKPVALVPAPAVHVDAAAAEAQRQAGLPVDERCKAQWDANAQGVRGEFTSLEAFTAYTRAAEAGKGRTLGRKAA